MRLRRRFGCVTIGATGPDGSVGDTRGGFVRKIDRRRRCLAGFDGTFGSLSLLLLALATVFFIVESGGSHFVYTRRDEAVWDDGFDVGFTGERDGRIRTIEIVLEHRVGV
jgi:hypothetical protein